MSCTCTLCVSACERYPGWMTPDEARMAIDAGMGDRLMVDYYCSDEGDVEVLCPAVIGSEGCLAPFWVHERCTFLKEGLCQVHDTGWKPRQCRTVFGCNNMLGDDKIDFVPLWNTDESRELIESWKDAHQHGEGND